MMRTISSRWPLPSDLTSGFGAYIYQLCCLGTNLLSLAPCQAEYFSFSRHPGIHARRCINKSPFASNFAFASLAWTHRGKLKISQPSQSHVALSPANMVTRRRVFRLAPPVTLTLIIMYSHALHTCTIEQEDINIDILVTCDVT